MATAVAARVGTDALQNGAAPGRDGRERHPTIDPATITAVFGILPQHIWRAGQSRFDAAGADLGTHRATDLIRMGATRISELGFTVELDE